MHVHPLNTPTYLRETVLPNLEAGAARSGRRVEHLEVIVPAFLVVGDTDVERALWCVWPWAGRLDASTAEMPQSVSSNSAGEGTTDLIRER